MTAAIEHPASDEYAPYYAAYVSLVPDGDIIQILDGQVDTLPKLLSGLSGEQANFRFGPEEWSVKEVVGHINDAERVFAYRALRFARNDPTPLPGFEQNSYVREANFDARTLPDLVQEFEWLRRANILAFKLLSADMSQRRGMASGYGFSVRALLYIMAGHVEHHVESLKTNYLSQINV
jgi:hypothetical protein